MFIIVSRKTPSTFVCWFVVVCPRHWHSSKLNSWYWQPVYIRGGIDMVSNFFLNFWLLYLGHTFTENRRNTWHQQQIHFVPLTWTFTQTLSDVIPWKICLTPCSYGPTTKFAPFEKFWYNRREEARTRWKIFTPSPQKASRKPYSLDQLHFIHWQHNTLR